MIATRYNPQQVFAHSKSPAGLYARKQWYHEEATEAWQRDFNTTVTNLRNHQSTNGSWENSEMVTIRRLFGLHLTVRNAGEKIEHALIWLLKKIDDTQWGNAPLFYKKADFYGLPFSPGCFRHFLLCSYLFLSVCFGHGEDKRVLSLYNGIAENIESNRGHLCNVYCTNNALRAFVVHTGYSRSRATSMMVKYLRHRQLPSGKWKAHTPFYMTFNALAHLDSEDALIQCTKAIKALIPMQNRNGSWGRKDKEWNTFLVVHGLNRLHRKQTKNMIQ